MLCSCYQTPLKYSRTTFAVPRSSAFTNGDYTSNPSFVWYPWWFDRARFIARFQAQYQVPSSSLSVQSAQTSGFGGVSGIIFSVFTSSCFVRLIRPQAQSNGSRTLALQSRGRWETDRIQQQPPLTSEGAEEITVSCTKNRTAHATCYKVCRMYVCMSTALEGDAIL